MMVVPGLLTVSEAARVMRVSRTRAYQLARQHRVTGGAAGLPVVQVGNMLRVPRGQLEQWLGTQITVIPPESRGLSPPRTPRTDPAAASLAIEPVAALDAPRAANDGRRSNGTAGESPDAPA